MILYNVLKYLSKFLMDETNEKIGAIHRGERVTVCEMWLAILGCIAAILLCLLSAFSIGFLVGTVISAVVIWLLTTWWLTVVIYTLAFVGTMMAFGSCLILPSKISEWAKYKCSKEYKIEQ